MDVEDSPVPKQNLYKRKRKKSFLTNARKYGKRGYYGRGNQLDSDTYQYFIRVMEVYKEGFASEEDKLMLVNNVFTQTENEEINYSSNQVGCRVIQLLLPFANNHHLERYMEAFLSNMRPLTCDRFASHVLQTIFEVACRKTFQNDVEEEFKQKCNSTVTKISKFLLNNLEDYIWDMYGNHVIRTVLIGLAQIQDPNKIPSKTANSVMAADTPVNDLPDEYIEIIKDYAQRLITWPQFADFAYSELTSGFLQILLQVLKKIDSALLKVYVKKLVKDCFTKSSKNDECSINSENTPDVFASKPAIMLMESVLESASGKLFKKIFKKCFANKLVVLGTTRNTNFAVQKLLSHCTDKEMFETMFDELAGSFQSILEAGHSGIILTLAQTCKRLATKQGVFIQNIMKLLNCYEPDERQNSIVMCLCKFITYEDLPKLKVIDEEFLKTKLSLHGILIIQVMLEFNKPIKIVTSILSNNAGSLKILFLNNMGSHIVDSYMNSKFVGENSREKLIRLMQGTYQELAASKYGSRTFDAMWNVAHIKQKMNIMFELSHKDALWSNSEFGKIIARKVDLLLYKKNIEEWKNAFNKVSKK